MKLFDDRVDAGRQLAQRLDSFGGPDVVVLGLPRGGVPVAFEVAKALQAPLDVLVVRKLGVPFQPELAFGAIGEDGVRVLNDSVSCARPTSTATTWTRSNASSGPNCERRAERFRRGRDRISLTGRVAVIVDDGIATGATAKAACQVARAHGASRVVLAVPIGPDDIVARFAGYADEVVCLQTPAFFFAVGQGYRNFTQTSDDEVVALLDRARNNFAEAAAIDAAADPPLRDEEVRVLAGPVTVAGHLTIPENPTGIVVFAHGSGSSRHSPRNRYVAEVLNQAGLATLLFDLLTPAEERNRANVFDIELLASRLVDVTGWLATPARHRVAAGRLLRRKHRGGCGAGRGRRSPSQGGSHCVPRRPARPRGSVAGERRGADAADRGRTRPGGPRIEPTRASGDTRAVRTHRGARRHAPV